MRLLPCVFVCACCFAQGDRNALRILERVAHKYQNLDSYVISGTATREGLKVAVLEGYASSRVIPQDAPLPFVDARAVYKNAPERLYRFRDIARGVTGAKVLRIETLSAGGQPRECDVVSAVYKDDPVVYWIERATSVVWKMEFNENGRWTMVVDKWTENGELPPWLKGGLAKRTTNEDTRLLGQTAPEVTGRTLDGKPFALSKLRGQIVVMDFWATSCGFCAEEMAEMEELRGAVIVGVNQDGAELAKRWMADKKRTLPVVLVEPDTAFKAYHVESLPTTVVIDREGKVVKQWIEYARGSRIKRMIESLAQ